jgi:hypothetical protein
MSLITLVVVLIVIGLVMYLVQMLPIDAKFKQIIQVVLILFCIIWLLGMIGVFPGLKLR